MYKRQLQVLLLHHVIKEGAEFRLYRLHGSDIHCASVTAYDTIQCKVGGERCIVEHYIHVEVTLICCYITWETAALLVHAVSSIT